MVSLPNSDLTTYKTVLVLSSGSTRGDPAPNVCPQPHCCGDLGSAPRLWLSVGGWVENADPNLTTTL